MELFHQPFVNDGRFANHYLLEHLPRNPRLWRTEGLEEARDGLLTLWQTERDKVAGYSEAQLEERFILTTTVG